MLLFPARFSSSLPLEEEGEKTIAEEFYAAQREKEAIVFHMENPIKETLKGTSKWSMFTE